jgi:hypothetical protein
MMILIAGMMVASGILFAAYQDDMVEAPWYYVVGAILLGWFFVGAAIYTAIKLK